MMKYINRESLSIHTIDMNGSDWIRLQRAKALVLGKQSTPNNRTGDYFVERRFGAAPVLFRGVEIKPCCSPSTSTNIAVVLIRLLLGGGTVGNIIIPTLPAAIVNGPLTLVVSNFLKKLSSDPASFGVNAPSLDLADPSSILSTLVDVIKANPTFLDNAKTYIEGAFAESSSQEQINNDALTIISTLKDENGTNQVYATLDSLQTQLGVADYSRLVQAFSPLIYG